MVRLDETHSLFVAHDACAAQSFEDEVAELNETAPKVIQRDGPATVFTALIILLLNAVLWSTTPEFWVWRGS